MVARRGLSFAECIAALAILQVVGASLLVAGVVHFRSIGEGFDELAAQRALAGHLERYVAGALRPEEGHRKVALPGGLSGEETVRQLEPRLFEVSVEVEQPNRGRDGSQTWRLQVLVAAEAGP